MRLRHKTKLCAAILGGFLSFASAHADDGLSLPNSPGKTARLINSADITNIVSDNDASVGFGSRYMVVFIDYGVKGERSQILSLLQFVKFHPEWKIVIKELPLVSQESLDIALAQAAVVEQQNELVWREFEGGVLTAKSTLTPAALRSLAEKTGVDMAKYDDALKSGRALAKIQANRKIAEQVHIDGTPFFVTDNKVMKGMMNYPALVDYTDAQ